MPQLFQKIKIIGVATGIIFFLLSLLSALQFFRFQHLLFDITQARVEVPAEALKRDIERSIATGIALQTNAQLPLMLNNVIQTNPNVLAIELIDLGSASQEVLVFAGKRPASSTGASKIGSSTSKASVTNLEGPPVFLQQWPIVDALGVTVARLTFTSDKSEALGIAATARAELMTLALTLFLAALGLLVPILFLVLTKLDKIVLAAKSVMLGKNADKNTLLNSEVCQLAQNAQDAKHASTPVHPTASPL